MNNKKASRRVLGKGLSSLIPTVPDDTFSDENQIMEIGYASIKPNPFQPRREFDEEEIRNLAESIASQGLLQPVIVRQKENNDFEIISGERRFRALRSLGRDTIPCVVKTNVSDRDMTEMTLVENIQREDLNEIEKADAYQRLLLEYKYTHEELSKRIGKSRTVITNSLRLLGLPEEVQRMVRKNELSMGHARALLAMDTDERRLELAKKVRDEKWSVREIERAVQDSSAQTKRKPILPEHRRELDPNIADAVNRLQYKLGTAVTLTAAAGGRGKIEMAYYSDQDLTRLFDLLLSGS